MKKTLTLAALLLMPLLFTPSQAQAAPLYSGTSLFALNGGSDSMSVNWSVYASTATAPGGLAGLGAGYVYQYSLASGNGSAGTYNFSALLGASVPITGAMFADAPNLLVTSQTPSGATSASALSATLTTNGPVGDAVGLWWSSTAAPVISSVTINGVTDTSTIMAPGVPGLPEPQTWRC
ncbi:MAG: hypothetical protein COS82_10195 [Zetaproteobacteria bacterium CG06_land_8_20_14_3_00_59_53]|nr:MAG: hypothetical protein AUK36_02170 [Zetaproteobacteria bacterium CG2_30_59_37]PIO89476.1 MAG: hypothetical protein COX56_07645 [Zetaproteobacteria bacterium CG23_combo_of_CG06-09_8_20_14_all_59_86]PIQ65501.1 MAG: hypothetical protein COV97_04000 [Zetaproteobacteria bacterium CG11_big_fil_rev_8_21_14_0_20_59_439]PIU69753.1 MAG: hypothetical protein COS82_10195 [Zetaproteobacteria bacterium CG06_land_8_20_14_3_00_59_53]PIU97002.1 MAG: hypothetical protein COS62_06325 [Zetaproteobacteria bac